MLLSVLQVERCYGADERVAGVTVCEEGADGKEHLADGQRRWPVVLEDVEANVTLAVDVTVVDPCPERHLQAHNQS